MFTDDWDDLSIDQLLERQYASDPAAAAVRSQSAPSQRRQTATRPRPSASSDASRELYPARRAGDRRAASDQQAPAADAASAAALTAAVSLLERIEQRLARAAEHDA